MVLETFLALVGVFNNWLWLMVLLSIEWFSNGRESNMEMRKQIEGLEPCSAELKLYNDPFLFCVKGKKPICVWKL